MTAPTFFDPVAPTAVIERMRQTGESVMLEKSYVRSDGKLKRVQNSASVISDGIGPRRLVATVRPLVDAAPIGTLESNLITVTRMLRARRGRVAVFGSDRFAGSKWDIALACYKLECTGPRVTVSDLCREIAIDVSRGMLLVLEMVGQGDLDIERAGQGLEDSSIRMAPLLQNDLGAYLARHGGPPSRCD
ncbi:MAG: histidine kinase [Sphingomonas sp.]|nr:MAG: histidine kinase [Sphingomonas sp.]